MNQERGNDVFSWLQRWISPQGTREDEANLERQVGEDPFLADAMEGYRQFPKQNHSATLTDIRNKLQPVKQTRVVIGFSMLSRIAAACLLLIIAIAGFYFLNSDDQSIASQQSKRSPSVVGADQESEAKADDAINGGDLAENSDTEIASLEEKTLLPAKPSMEKPIAMAEEASEDMPEVLQPKPIPQIDALEPDRLESLRSRSNSDIPPYNDAKRSADEFFNVGKAEFDSANAPTPPGEPQYLVGFVQDDIGEPIIGASVVVPGTTVGTITGVDGRFSLKWDKNYRTLQFQSLGFTSQTKNISGPDTMKVVLNESNTSLESVTMSEFKTSDKRKESAGAGKAVSIEASPVGGFKKLERFVKKNLQKPAANIVGTVQLQFVVHPDGTLSTFKVLQSLCASCDEEAIRLLRIGPKWQIESGNQPVIKTYTIPFE